MPPHTPLVPRWTAPALLLAALLGGCAPLSERSYTLAPEHTASVFGFKTHSTFGICDPFFLDRRGTRLYVWDEFRRQHEAAAQPVAMAGYEVGVSRGQTCHLRIVDAFQAAARFDLSALPASAALVSAELRIERRFAPRDPPYDRGSTAQCAILLAGQATQAWEPGPRTGAFIPSLPARPASGPHAANGTAGVLSINVGHTVGEWMRGTQPNHGFVLSPDMERVLRFYGATEAEGGYMCDLGIARLELVVTVVAP